MCRTRQTRQHSPTWFARTHQTRRHLPTQFARTRQTRESQFLQVLCEFGKFGESGEFGKFSECRLDHFILIKYVICALNDLSYHVPTFAQAWQVLARLANIHQPVLLGLARLADIHQPVLLGLARLANIRQRPFLKKCDSPRH